MLCGELATKIGAVGCSLVMYISGVPEGCECEMRGAGAQSCPAPVGAMGFTGVSEDNLSKATKLSQMGSQRIDELSVVGLPNLPGLPYVRSTRQQQLLARRRLSLFSTHLR